MRSKSASDEVRMIEVSEDGEQMFLPFPEMIHELLDCRINTNLPHAVRYREFWSDISYQALKAVEVLGKYDLVPAFRRCVQEGKAGIQLSNNVIYMVNEMINQFILLGLYHEQISRQDLTKRDQMAISAQ